MTDDFTQETLQPKRRFPSPGQAFLYGGIFVAVLHTLITGNWFGAFFNGLIGGFIGAVVAAIALVSIRRFRKRLLAVVVPILIWLGIGVAFGAVDWHLYESVLETPRPATVTTVRRDFSSGIDPAQLLVVHLGSIDIGKALIDAGFERDLDREQLMRDAGNTRNLELGKPFFRDVSVSPRVEVWEKTWGDYGDFDLVVYDPSIGRAWIARYAM